VPQRTCTRLGAKNLELLRELVPDASVIGILVNQSNPNAAPQLHDLQAAARAHRRGAGGGIAGGRAH
jgi:hypothetical protein